MKSATAIAFIFDRLLVPSLVIRPKKKHFPNVVIEAMKKDKKRTGEGLALIIMKDGYEMVKVNDLSPSEAASDLAKIGAILGIWPAPSITHTILRSDEIFRYSITTFQAICQCAGH